MKQLLIYDQPIVLNRVQHRHLRIKPSLTDFRFARTTNSVPLTTLEFADAARDYPIVFSGDPEQPGMPAALLGLSHEDNLFVQDDGAWAADSYVPAFVRRYPFVVANQDDASDGFAVCIDKSFLCEEQEGLALFDESGADTPALTRALTFLTDCQRAIERTQAFMQQLRESKLLIARAIQVEQPGGGRQSLNGFCVVDEERLQKLGSRVLEKLSRTGTLGLLYVHLMSLTNVRRLSARMDMRTRTSLH